jgi:mono/diheme cytochrome c family protein
MVLRICFSSIFLFIFFSCGSNGTIKKLDEKGVQIQPTVQDLYNENCSVCHGSDGKLGAAGAKDLTLSKLSSIEVQNRIEKGKNGMPPMKKLLGSKENITAMTEYVLRMR